MTRGRVYSFAYRLVTFLTPILQQSQLIQASCCASSMSCRGLLLTPEPLTEDTGRDEERETIEVRIGEVDE